MCGIAISRISIGGYCTDLVKPLKWHNFWTDYLISSNFEPLNFSNHGIYWIHRDGWVSFHFKTVLTLNLLRKQWEPYHSHRFHNTLLWLVVSNSFIHTPIWRPSFVGILSHLINQIDKRDFCTVSVSSESILMLM